MTTRQRKPAPASEGQDATTTEHDQAASDRRVRELEEELRALREQNAAAQGIRPPDPTHRIFYVCGCTEDTAVPAGTELDCAEHDGVFPVVNVMLIRKG